MDNPFEAPSRSSGRSGASVSAPRDPAIEALLERATVPAGFGVRVAAYLLDGLLLGLFAGGGALVLAGFVAATASVEGGAAGLEAAANAVGLLMQLGFVAIFIVYGAVFESSASQATPGKMAMGLRVVAPDGGRLSFGMALVRNLVKYFSLGFCGLLGFYPLLDDQQRAIHDMVGTKVVAPY